MTEHEEQIIDVKAYCYANTLRAERKGDNTLILSKLDNTVKRFDGKKARFILEHRWHRPGADIYSVQGQDFTYWTTSEIDPDKCLFNQVNLF